MSRWIAILIGSVALVGGGVAHGLWTDRWHRSEELARAAERFALLPDDLGPWKGEAVAQTPEALAMAGAVAHYSRDFRDPETGEHVMVILLVGKPARMSVHRPEHCYQAAGYGMIGAPVVADFQGEGFEPAKFFTASFSHEEADGPSQLRIFWAFSAGERWEAPDSPRTRFARRGVLYKLYIIRNVSGSSVPLGEEPGVRLMGLLLPELKRTLSAGS